MKDFNKDMQLYFVVKMSLKFEMGLSAKFLEILFVRRVFISYNG